MPFLKTGFSLLLMTPSFSLVFSNCTILLVLVYVDDIIVTGSTSKLIQNLIASLQAFFAIKDLGLLHYFLGIEVTKTANSLHLSQTKYVRELLTRANMHQAHLSPSPMVPNTSLSQFDGDLFNDLRLYRSIVCALQYATLTRPDITFVVNKVSQFLHSPTTSHWATIKRILRYLQGINFKPCASFILHAYSDSNWAGSPDDHKSTSNFCIFLRSNIISWGSKKLNTILRSIAKSEYRALTVTSVELIWVQYVLSELKVFIPNPPTLWCDNVGATYLASNPIFHTRTKIC